MIRVLFGKYSGSDIKIDDEEYLIMREDEILGVIERDSDSGSRNRWQKRRQVSRAFGLLMILKL
ncbi:MAG: hypothetical protein WKF84_07815 [Pyrinomonadaceae bacterium]